jgi:hypothetical protein
VAAIAAKLGTPLMPWQRHVVDVALEIVFESHAAHDAYQTADRHAQFIAEQAPNWAKVRVFDVDIASHHPPA